MNDLDGTLRNLHAARNDPSEAGYIVEEMLASEGDLVERLLSTLASLDAEIRSGAAIALGCVGFFSEGICDAVPAIPSLVRATEDCDPWVAFHATQSLWRIRCGSPDCGLDHEDMVQRIAVCLESKFQAVRVAAVEAFGFIPNVNELILPRLIDRLEDSSLEVRFVAAQELVLYGHRASRAFPKFMGWIDGDVPEEVFVAGIAIIKSDKTCRESLVPVLLETFGHIGDAYRANAVYLLSQIVEAVPQAVPLLARYYEVSSDRDVRRAVVDVFAGIASEVPEALPILVKAVLDEAPDIAIAASDGLSILRENAAEAVPNLVSRLDSELTRDIPNCRRAKRTRDGLLWNLCTTLGCIGPAASPAILSLQRASRHDDQIVRRAARKALVQVGAETPKDT